MKCALQPTAWPILSCIFFVAVPIFPVGAQQTTDFPDEKCSYTLPDAEWEWLDPALVKKTKLTTLAKNKSGLVFTLESSPISPEESLSEHSYYQSFEAGYLKSSNSQKIAGGKIEFQGLPAYRIDAKMAVGPLSYLVVVCANDRSYNLLVVDGSSRVAPEVIQKVFNGFEFTGRPQPVFKSEKVGASTRAEKIGEAIGSLVVLIVVAYGAYRLLTHKKKSEPGKA